MSELSSSYYELRFLTQFQAAQGTAFQELFVAVMSKAHPEDFIPCRPWGSIGDRKCDGYLKSERTLFQIYAPNEMKLSKTLRKINEDFAEALPYWRDHFDTWVFVHDSLKGLPPDVIAGLLQLERDHPEIQVTHWGFDELLLRFRTLTPEALSSLYGPLPESEQKRGTSEARRKLNLAQEMMRDGRQSDAIEEMVEALSLAEASGDEEEETEVLIALAIASSDRRGRGDRQHYFQRAEAKLGTLKSPAAKVLYHRARAGGLEEARDASGAEEAYREALRLCSSENDDEKGNLATQGCIVRASLVHLLCSQKRFDEAEPLLSEAEACARARPTDEEGEILQAVLEAGIHYALDLGDEGGAIARVEELERAATTARLADRIGGDLINVANQASHRGLHRTAAAAAQASIRLGHKGQTRSPRFLAGALYTEAMVILKAGNPGLALSKAEALLDLCQTPEDSTIRQAVQHLIAEIRRTSGDSQAAVDLARQALAGARGRPEDIAFTKAALARALHDNGQTEEALKHAKEAWTLIDGCDVPAEGRVDVLSLVADYASQLGAGDEIAEALQALDRIPDDSEAIREERQRFLARVEANTRLRERLTGTLRRGESAQAAGTADCQSLAEANASVVRPLLQLWDGFGRDAADALAGMYDFWGRGNFERLLLNAKRFPNSFNITLEVRSLEDVARAVRIWGLYADFLVLLWKGPTDNGIAIAPVPDDYEEPGGWGYMIAADVLDIGDPKREWHPALGYSSMFPAEVAAYLATEARPFLAAGRLIVVPAVGAGCINPGHGPFEQLLAEAANAIPSVRWKMQGTPIGLVPHSPNAPLELLAELAEAEATRLRQLRLLFLRRTQQLRPDGDAGLEAKVLSLEIEDALRDFEDRNEAFSYRKGFAKAKEPLHAAVARFRTDGSRLSKGRENTPYAPLFMLQSLGYGWCVDSSDIPKLPKRFEPDQGDVVGTWLAPPTAGWTIPTARRV